MQPLLKQIKKLADEVGTATKQLDIDEKLTQQSKLEAELAKPDAWNNSSTAQNKSKKLASLKSATEPWENLRAQLEDLTELIETDDESLKPEVEEQLKSLQKEFDNLKKQLQFNWPI